MSTKVDTHQQQRETVRGGAVWACRTAGAMGGAYEPPGMGLRRVLQAHIAPPSLGRPEVAFDVDSAGAGRSPAEPLFLDARAEGQLSSILQLKL
ncbi:hypothetical protein ORG27_10530, partial [Stenotrophomonas lactitubi]|uniref:hypothetical protein n=1 Tax=Stenotrophomonas lactitubi TaxID=2045214 RepID=UPI0022496BED